MTQNEDHIEPLRLFDLAWTDALQTDEETKHLSECEQCEDAFEFLTGVTSFSARMRSQKGMDSIPLNDPPNGVKEMPESVAIRRASSIFDEMKDIHDRIMRRAFEVFEHNGRVFGKDLDNWLQAERELLWKPAVELREKDGEFLLEAAVSGVDPRDIDIEITPEDIVLKTEVEHEYKQEKGTVHVCEFQSGKMFRSIHLPKKINPDKVKAELTNGLLRVSAQIAEEAQRGTTIKREAA
jgi:HSP20 family molecular chaperone IbpA